MSETNNNATINSAGGDLKTNRISGNHPSERHVFHHDTLQTKPTSPSAKSVPKGGNNKTQGKTPNENRSNRNKNRNKSKKSLEQNAKSVNKSTDTQQRNTGMKHQNLKSIEHKRSQKRNTGPGSKHLKPITKKYDPEVELLKEKQKEELRIVKARLGPKNFQTYRSSPDFTVFAVSCMIDLNSLDLEKNASKQKPKQKRKVKFTITVPKLYPKTSITLGNILTPALGAEDSPLKNTHDWNKIVTNFNTECSRLLKEQHQPLLQQLNYFAVNFPAMCVPNKAYLKATDLKKQLIAELSL
ncbi:hypothetical protein ACO0RG_000069 [Hanseniaspora osmophila]|uniref:Uncharacterized protein n=1 Tax=Hanseniaspora osmophila TaxID=56408 RepID=A0A1E5R5F6_9ASCO|nr:hypothetical protein AWRI3579_g3560 [Hanseniaspora osmophila]